MNREAIQEYFINILKQEDAYWLHDGNPKRPHAELTSGKHSDGFINCSALITDPQLVRQIVEILYWQNFEIFQAIQGSISKVFGSAMGAIDLSYEFGRYLRVKRGFTEKSGKEMVQGRFNVRPGDHLLLVEDVVSTFGTSQKSIDVLESDEVSVFEDVFAIANRSGKSEINGRKIHSVINVTMRMDEPEECELCKIGLKSNSSEKK